jgi:hypothetical protein
MKLTNKFNLPPAIENAIRNFEKNYTAGRGDTKISVTQLHKPPLMLQLEQRHWEELEEDVSDRIWVLFGSAIHYLLEHSAGKDDFTEERLKTVVNNWVVSGQADHFDAASAVLSDYKVTSAWAVLDGFKTEWEQQLNVLKYLFELAGFEVKQCQIVAILRDWSKKNYLQDVKKMGDAAKYPQCPVKVVDIPIWTREHVLEYLNARVAAHQYAATQDINQIPQCTPEERWERPTVYALMKEGRKSAVKLYDTENEANAAATDKGHYVEIRQGQSVRCEDYCSANRFCPYYKSEEDTDSGSI